MMQDVIANGNQTTGELFEMMYGCYTELSNENYHAIKSHVSRSAIMDFAKSPYNYWAKHLNPDRPKKTSTPAMELGTAFHTLILEFDRFNNEYAILPPKILLKDVGRDAYEEHKEKCEKIESSNKITIPMETWFLLCDMKSRIESHQQAMQLIKDGRIENSFFWQDEHSGLGVKARPDILHDNMIVDLKTCNDASPRAFQSAMVLGGYHIQGAMIRDGVLAIEDRRINNVINICIETKYPHNIGIYIIDEFAIDEGQVKYKNILLELKNAAVHNTYENYGIQTIGLPRWAI